MTHLCLIRHGQTDWNLEGRYQGQSDVALNVSHGLSIATAICRAQNIPVGQAYSVIPENVQPVWMEWNADRPDSN